LRVFREKKKGPELGVNVGKEHRKKPGKKEGELQVNPNSKFMADTKQKRKRGKATKLERKIPFQNLFYTKGGRVGGEKERLKKAGNHGHLQKKEHNNGMK